MFIDDEKMPGSVPAEGGETPAQDTAAGAGAATQGEDV